MGKVGPVEATGYHRGHLQFWPSLGDVPLSARLLPLVAEARAIPFTALPVHETVRVTTKSSLIRGAKHRLSRSLGPYRRSYRSPRNRRRSTTLMLWYAGYGAKQLAADERRAGAGYCLHHTRHAVLSDHRSRVPAASFPSRPIDLKVLPTLALGQEVLTLLEELDEWAGVSGASRILESRLAVYLHGICRTVLRAARLTRGELSHFGIDRLAAANPSSLEEYACLLAARSAHIPRLLVQHGDHLLPYGSWLVSETVNFDDFAASDPLYDCRRVRRRCDEARRRRTACHVLRATHCIATGNCSVTTGCGWDSGPGLLRAVVFSGDLRRIGGCNFDDAWYHRWHLRLLDLMAHRPDLRFLWKALPASDQAFDPIPGLIADRELHNVEYEVRPFVEILGEVERVFTDYPSTALYEAVHVGKPILGFDILTLLRGAAGRCGALRARAQAGMRHRGRGAYLPSPDSLTLHRKSGCSRRAASLFLDDAEHERQLVERQDR